MWASCMKSELPVGAASLIAERTRLESLLQSSEDWRALQQLRSRTERGEGLSAVSSKNLEAMLVDALAENPFFGPYKSVCLAIERLTAPVAVAKNTPAADANAAPANDVLSRIRGIDSNLARRLNELGVSTFAEIADWRAADIQRVANALSLGKQIYSQNWIEQAALLALTSPNKAPAKKALEPATPPSTQDSKGQSPEAAKPVATAAVEPDADPNQLTLNFSRNVDASPAKAAPSAQPPMSNVPTGNEPSDKPKISADGVERPAGSNIASTTPVAKVPTTENISNDQSQQTVAPEVKLAESAPASIRLSATGPAPRPLPPSRYGQALSDTPPVAPQRATATPQSPTSTTAALVPPRPLVVTRASLPLLNPASTTKDIAQDSGANTKDPATAVPAMSIAEALAYAAEIERKSQSSGTTPKTIPDSAKVQATPAVQPPSLRQALMQSATPSTSSAQPAGVTPPRPAPSQSATATNTQSVSQATVQAAAAAAAAVARAAPPQTPAAREPVRVAPPPIQPPPLPASFVAPEPPPPPPPSRQVRIEHARPVEREDFSNRSSVEEASVEIVRKNSIAAPQAPSINIDPVPEIVVAAPAPPDADPGSKDKRGPTPIGRFLKALSGNN
jgi:predicted flap endonuclease-1-like 5' DNA nuclease